MTRTTDARPAPKADWLSQLASTVPVASLADCAGCADPCDDADAPYGRKFEVDLTGSHFGQLPAFLRLAVCATGKSDWAHDVTSVDGTLAHYAAAAASSASSGGKSAWLGKLLKRSSSRRSELPDGVHGSVVLEGTDATKVTILNGSLRSDDASMGSMLVFPDFKLVRQIPISADGAQALFADHLAPSARPAPSSTSTLRSWPLPYRAVILLCSHKKRDNRCAIAAPILAEALSQHIEHEHWHVDRRGDGDMDGPPIEEWPSASTENSDAQTEAQRADAHDEALRTALRTSAKSDVVGIFDISHIGGHRWSGNVIVCLPSGATVWYGLVRPQDCAAIVQTTIRDGRVIPELLRGGVGLARDSARTLLDW